MLDPSDPHLMAFTLLLRTCRNAIRDELPADDIGEILTDVVLAANTIVTNRCAPQLTLLDAPMEAVQVDNTAAFRR